MVQTAKSGDYNYYSVCLFLCIKMLTMILLRYINGILSHSQCSGNYVCSKQYN